MTERTVPSYGFDFSRFRVHSGPEARTLAAGLSARAFTVGSHIFIADDALHTDPPEGHRVLRPELAHVAQSPEIPLSGGASLPVARAEDRFEWEAIAAAKPSSA